MRPSPGNQSTPDPRLVLFLAVVTALAVVSCRDDPVSSSGPATSEAPSSTTVATSPPSPSSTGSPSTTMPVPRGTEVEVVAPCEAEDQRIVAADVVPIGGEMAVAEGRVWISSLAAGGLVPVDAETLCPREPVVIDNAAFGVTAMDVAENGTLYTTAARTGDLASLDPSDGTVTPLAPGVDGGGGVAVAGGLLWAVCCDADSGEGGGAVIDVATGEVVADIPLDGPAVGIGVVGDTAWIGRRDAAGVYRVDLSADGVEVDRFEAVGAYTVDVAASEEGVWLVTDEPAIQRLVDGEVEEATALPFPRERGVDLEVDADGGVWAVSAFGPGVVWLRADGVAFNALGAESLIQVEVTDRRVWASTTDGALVRLDRAVLDG